MGQPASTIDWSAASDTSGAFRVIDGGAETLPPLASDVAPRAGDSAIRLKSEQAWEPGEESADDDEPTRPYVRAALPLPVRDPVGDLDRATGCAVARLGSLLEWIAEEDATSEVVAFVRSFLAQVGELSQALDTLSVAVRRSPSESLRVTAEAFACAAAIWRANLVDHVDELTLMNRGSLEGWSSLPEYSAMYVLAFVMPMLDPMRECTGPARAEMSGLQSHVRAVEDAIVELNWTLRSAAADSAIGDVAQLETAGRAIAW